MEALTRLIICAVLSFLIGIACVAPLLVTELDIKPFEKQLQNPTEYGAIDLIYANFTVINESTPITQYSGPDIAYSVVYRISNPSNYSTSLYDLIFTAETNNATSGNPMYTPEISQQGYNVEGAWVNGKWYNITLTNGLLPTTDETGKIAVASDSSNMPNYWIQGIQLDDVYVNGTLTYTYMDMNGTWTDVTGKIDVTHPVPLSPWAKGLTGKPTPPSTIVTEHYIFESVPPVTSSPVTDKWAPWVMQYVPVGEGQFNDTWAPGQSRLIRLSGIYEVRQSVGIITDFSALKVGNITLTTQIMDLTKDIDVMNKTYSDNSAFPMQQKQIQLTPHGDSYIYNAILGANQKFRTDQWGVEVFIE